ncbi:MAG: oxidoreductase [Sporomusaceae bacterium]|nr:oxidoreductase [Sporomusaceae bacterium]
MRKIHAGIIGYGLSGAVFHAPLLAALPEFTIRGVVSSTPEKVKRDYPQAAAVPTVAALLADAEIELVVVASPNATHFDYARQALLAGKHVVVEKPFVNSVRQADELISLAAERGLQLSVFQNRRWDNDFLTVQRCVKEGLLGRIYFYEAHYDLFRPQVGAKWKEHAGEGTGALYDLGPHLIDQALQLFGMPQAVWAELAGQRPGAEADDFFHLVMSYDSLRVVLHSGSIVRQAGPHFQVHGDGGSLIKYGMDPQQSDLQRGLRPGGTGWGRDREENYALVTLGRNLTLSSRVETVPGCYEAYYQGLYQSIVNRTPLPVTADEARNVMLVIEAAVASHRQQRRISLPDSTHKEELS